MIRATPTGLRNVNSCLSGISLGTVCPYSRRPSPRKKSQVSMTSWTSPSASAIGLPISRVMRAASDSLLASTSRPTWAMTRPRAGAGVAAQAGAAARADRNAATTSSAVARSTSATTSERSAGFRDWCLVMPASLPDPGAVPPISSDSATMPTARAPGGGEDAGVEPRTTAGAVLDLLAAQGVTTAFGLPGVHNLAFWDALGAGRPAIVGVRHEQTAAYAADGLARATGGLGVALTTTGPGAANALAAFGEAAASGSPVLLIASEVSTVLRRPGTVRGILHESIDQAALFAPLAKAVYRPESPLAAVEAVARAVTTAMTYPRGPVYVGIPVDVLGTVVPAEDRPLPTPRISPVQSPATADIDAALELIASSRRPLIWVGGGAVASGAADARGRTRRPARCPGDHDVRRPRAAGVGAPAAGRRRPRTSRRSTSWWRPPTC